MSRKVMPIEAALLRVQQHPAWIVPDERMGVDIWSPMNPLEPGVRRSVHSSREKVLTQILASEAAVCPAKKLHQKEWVLVGDKLICRLCHTFTQIGIC
jgi:hypothetical protein